MLRAALDGRSSGSLSSRGTLGAPLSRLRRRAAGQKASGMESGSSLSRDEASAEREEMPPDLSPCAVARLGVRSLGRTLAYSCRCGPRAVLELPCRALAA